jgi:hypothetical protein
VLLLNDEARRKFLVPLRRVHRKKEIEICFDLQEELWVSFPGSAMNFTKFSQKIASMLEEDPDFTLRTHEAIFMNNYNTFLGILDLLSETCLGRNAKS